MALQPGIIKKHSKDFYKPLMSIKGFLSPPNYEECLYVFTKWNFKAGTHVINDSGLPCLKYASIQVEYYEFGLMVCVGLGGGV